MRAVLVLAGQKLAWAADEAEPLLMRLAPEQRSRVLMAILGILIVGFGLVGLAVLGGRYVLREARKSPGRTPLHEEGWYRKPLVPPEPNSGSARDSE